MEKIGKLGKQSPECDLEEESDETLAAIDEGIKDAISGRSLPASDVRKRLSQWITASAMRKER